MDTYFFLDVKSLSVLKLVNCLYTNATKRKEMRVGRHGAHSDHFHCQSQKDLVTLSISQSIKWNDSHNECRMLTNDRCHNELYGMVKNKEQRDFHRYPALFEFKSWCYLLILWLYEGFSLLIYKIGQVRAFSSGLLRKLNEFLNIYCWH
jgi:hypothetical protein